MCVLFLRVNCYNRLIYMNRSVFQDLKYSDFRTHCHHTGPRKTKCLVAYPPLSGFHPNSAWFFFPT